MTVFVYFGKKKAHSKDLLAADPPLLKAMARQAHADSYGTKSYQA